MPLVAEDIAFSILGRSFVGRGVPEPLRGWLLAQWWRPEHALPERPYAITLEWRATDRALAPLAGGPVHRAVHRDLRGATGERAAASARGGGGSASGVGGLAAAGGAAGGGRRWGDAAASHRVPRGAWGGEEHHAGAPGAGGVDAGRGGRGLGGSGGVRGVRLGPGRAAAASCDRSVLPGSGQRAVGSRAGRQVPPRLRASPVLRRRARWSW